MDLALYDPDAGYYARAAQRSGRAGDFFTSVDVGPLFGALLEIQIAEMAAILAATAANRPFELIEAGAGNGRLSTDILRAARQRDPDVYDRTRLHLVEASARAREAQRAAMGEVADRLVSSSAEPPARFDGVLLANELLDAFPVHQVVMRADGLHEVYVDVVDAAPGLAAATGLVAREGPPSTPALADYFARLGIALEPGWRAEVNLRALAWVRDIASRLHRGFLIFIDYGYEARELYSPTHAGGTLTTFARHTMAGPECPAGGPPWLMNPGTQDMTAHVDFTSIRAAGEAAGLTTLGFLDQTYFLLALADLAPFEGPENFKKRLALKTLLMPGGLGSTHKVLIFGKGVGTPVLRGCGSGMRVT